MNEKVIYRAEMPYRGSIDIKGFFFGTGAPAACIVGSLRGNEVQQLYICSQLVRRLNRLEANGAIAGGRQVVVIPCVNHISMNVGKRFWSVDNTDINRMFPGYDGGETTQRIADGLFKAVQGFDFGIQFPSFYLEGDFLPHVRIMEPDCSRAPHADAFGLPYVVARNPTPFDTTTLNYNWRLWDTDAYSLYTEKTDVIDEESAQVAVRACLRFLEQMGVIDYPCHRGYASAHLRESDLANTHTARGGIFRRLASPGDAVERGEKVGEVISPLTGEIREEVRASTSGLVFFAGKAPLVTEHSLVLSVVPRGVGCR